MAVTSLVGASVKRREDPRMITGTGQYVDDVKLVNMAYMAVLRSPHAHARITSIDAEAARQAPSVLCVLTGQDVKDRLGVVPVAAQLPDMKIPKHYVLAVDKVRFVGEPVAVVAAETRYAARDALALIEVEYEPEAAVVDIEKAIQPGAPLIHEAVGSEEAGRERADAPADEVDDPSAVRRQPRPDAEQITEAATAQLGPNSGGDANVAYTHLLTGGDVEQAFREADVTVKQRMVNQRLAPVPMETRTVAASFQAGADELTVWSSTQIPHLLKTQLALMLRVPEQNVRLISPDVGGGFGCKLNVYAEEALTAFLSIELGRPVNWVEQRSEGMQGTIHGRDQVAYIEAAAKRDGTITGLRYKVYADLGAYHQLLTPAIPTLTGIMVPGPYKIPNVTFELIGVFTNKMATDAYRGAGRPEATYYLERIVDVLAGELKMDPAELRRKNLIGRDAFPFTTATGLAYDSGNYEPALDKALQTVGYKQLRERQSAASSTSKRLGIGLSTYVEVCGMGPSAAMPAGGWESATVKMEPTGKVTVLTGAHPHGQGEETTFAQIVADALGVGIDDVRIVHGDTAVVQYGIGIFGSRGLSVGGSAVVQATDRVVEKAVRIAAHLLETSPDDVQFERGELVVKGAPDRKLSLQDVTTAAYMAAKLPPEIEPGLQATAFFEPPNFVYPFGTHVCVLEVDTDTGQIRVDRYVGVDDCGRVINPMIVDGQLHGGLAQGIAQALFEEVVYDEAGQLVTGTLNDYAIPKASDFPMFELSRTETPSPVNPLGVKGIGEAATIGSTPAVVNALCDALGVKHVDMPLRAERVWRAIQDKNGQDSNGR